MKLSEKLRDMHNSGEVELYVDGFADEAKLIENAIDALTDENRRLDLCLASKTDIANQLKDNLADAFMREANIKNESDRYAKKLPGILDELCDFKSALDGMMLAGMSAEQIAQNLEKQISFHLK